MILLLNVRVIVDIDPIVLYVSCAYLPVGQCVVGTSVKVNDYLKVS